jgi:integrase
MKRQPFTQEQVNNIIAKAKGEWGGITTLGAYTGQRLGDIVNFHWGNVGDSMLVFTSRKTKRKMRVPLHPIAAAWFSANRGKNTPEMPLFPLSLAKFEKYRGNVARLSDEFYSLLSELNYAEKRTHHTHGKGRSNQRAFSTLSFHSFRHFLTSQLHRFAVAPAIVMNIIGHESEAVHRIYTTIDDETMLVGIRKFEVAPLQPLAPQPTGGVVEQFPVQPALKEASNG